MRPLPPAWDAAVLVGVKHFVALVGPMVGQPFLVFERFIFGHNLSLNPINLSELALGHFASLELMLDDI